MDTNQEAQNIERILAKDTPANHSAFLTELHKLQALASKNGTLNVEQYRQDLQAIDNKLQADGLLPQLKLFLHDADGREGSKLWEDMLPGETKLPATDRTSETGNPKIEPSGAQVYEWHTKNRSGNHEQPDAMVLLPKDFDPNKPVHLVVYDHGWRDSAKSAYTNAKLAEQMAKAPPNTVLIVPEWQQSPRSFGPEGGKQGKFSEPGCMDGMVKEIFEKTPELKGKTLEHDVDRISIISHSAGYHAAETQLDKAKNPVVAGKVDSLTLLDSLYDEHGFDKWLHDNVKDLSTGKKHFHNVFTAGTEAASKRQAAKLEKWMREENLPTAAVAKDFEHKGSDMQHRDRHNVVFKSTATAHGEIPRRYAAVVVEKDSETAVI